MGSLFRSALLAVVVGAAGAGCSGPDTAAVRPQPDARRIAALTDSLAGAPSPESRAALVVRRLRAAGVTPLAAGSFRAGPDVVAGYVPGRQPLGRSTLVVVGTSLQGASVPAVMEAVRVLVARSRWEVVPERTVMVAFWDGADASDGLRQLLRAGLWPAASVADVLVVDAEAVPDARFPVHVAGGGTDLAAVARLAEQITAAARHRPASDSLVSP